MDLELIIGGIALAPIIVALIELAKSLGLPSKYAPFLNAALSVVAYVGVYLLGVYPGYTDWVVIALNILLIFLSGAGFNTTAKWILKK